MKNRIRAIAIILLLAAFVPAAQAATTYDYNYEFEVTSGNLAVSFGDNYSYVNLYTTSALTIDYSYDNEMTTGSAYEGIYSYFLEIEVQDIPLFDGFYTSDQSFDTDKSDEEFSTSDGLDISAYYGDYVGSTTISYEKYGLYDVNVSYAYSISGSGDTLSITIYYIYLSGGNLSSVLNDLVDEYSSYGIDLEGETLAAKITDGYGIVNANKVASEVPVPAAIWLLGSGLLGIVGLGKKRLN